MRIDKEVGDLAAASIASTAEASLALSRASAEVESKLQSNVGALQDTVVRYGHLLHAHKEEILEQLQVGIASAQKNLDNETGSLRKAIAEHSFQINGRVDKEVSDLTAILTAASVEASTALARTAADIDDKLANNVEDVRERVLQLRDAVEERAPAEHSHREFQSLADRAEELSAAVEAVEVELESLGGLEESVERLGDDPAEAARRLFAALRRLDASDADYLVAARPPGNHGLFLAVADRLRRASTER